MQIEGMAGRGRRFAAVAVDALIVPLLAAILIMVTDVIEDAEDFADNWWMLHVLLLAIAAYLLLNGVTLWRFGQTLGKRLFGIAVVNAAGELPAQMNPAPLWKLVFLRAWFFPLLFVALIPPLMVIPILDHLFVFGKQRRCLHDWLCGTMVVRVKQ